MTDDPASVPEAVRRFFLANPDEELTFEQLALKFGCTVWTARHAVRELKEAGLIESVHVIRNRSKGIAKEVG